MLDKASSSRGNPFIFVPFLLADVEHCGDRSLFAQFRSMEAISLHHIAA
jgi:hypothetical protein